MCNRAVIIAIETYADAKGAIAASLPGVHKAAEQFFGWLIAQKLVLPEDIFVCSDGMMLPPGTPEFIPATEPPIPLRYAATHDAIVECLANLLQVGTDETENLFVYCGGHGFAYTSDSTRPGLSFLLTSEFRTPARSGAACIDLDRIQRQLVRALSGTRHFHFIDCCRNLIPAESIEPVSALGIPFPASNNGEASCFVLYSARLGSTAAADTAFSDALMRGLQGFGYGKQLSGNSFWVTFDGVHKELKRVFGKPFDRTVAGVATGEILNLGENVTLPCTVIIQDDTTTDQYDLLIRKTDGWNQSVKLSPAGQTVDLSPSDRPYTFELRREGVPLIRTTPPPDQPIDMYLSCDLVFTPAPDRTTLILDTACTVREIGRPSLTSFSALQNVDFLTDDAEEIAWPDSDEDGGGGYIVSAATRPETLKLLARALFDEAEASEQLATGLLDDAGPATRLACAAVALAHSPDAAWTEALRQALPLHPPALAQWQSGLLLLAFSPEGAPRFSLHRDSNGGLEAMTAAKDLPDLYFAWLAPKPGSLYVTLQMPGRPPATFVSRTVAGHVTALTAHSADLLQAGGVRVQQFFCPPASAGHNEWVLAAEVAPAGNRGLSGQIRTLITARLLSLAQEQFLQRRSIWKADFASAEVWHALETRAWTNSELLILAAFDALRRGNQADLAALLELVGDSIALFRWDLACLKEQNISSPQTIPLLLDALLLAESHAGDDTTADSLFGIPDNRLDFRGMWVSWLAAIPPISEEITPIKNHA